MTDDPRKPSDGRAPTPEPGPDKEQAKGKEKDKDREKKSSGMPLLMLAVLLVSAVVVALIIWPLRRSHELRYSDLARLVQQGEAGQVEVNETGQGGSKQKVQYSGLHELSQTSPVIVGPEDITGKIRRQVIDPPPAEGETREPTEVSFTTPRLGLSEESVSALETELREKGFGYQGGQPPSVFGVLWFALLFSMCGVLLVLYLVWRFGGSGSAMAFGRHRGRLYAQEDIDVTFADVAGINEAVDELREVVEFLKLPEKYQRIGGRIPKGVLLVGPPGTGKTLLAKAIAGEAHVPYFSLSGSDFVEMYVGVGAARVRDMFQQAAAKAPCIIFIDELDALGKTRTGGHPGGEEREATLNALLVEMDGFGTNSGIIILGATNRPETLDPALMRPGRFDRHVLVDKPDVRGREAILKVHSQRVKLADDVNLQHIAAITSGFVGADLANLVNEAALLAARHGKESVGMPELTEGVERVTAGLEKKQRIMHEEEKKRVAYHESGHALVAYSLPNTDPVHKVSIIPRGLAALGYMMQRPEQDRYLMTQGELEARIKVLLAGTVTEEMIFGEVSTGAQNDLERASEIARRMVMEFGMSRLGRVNYRGSSGPNYLGGESRSRDHSEHMAQEIDKEVHRIIDESLAESRDILETRRVALEALATKLMEREVIDAEELREIVEEVSPTQDLSHAWRTPRHKRPTIISPAAQTLDAAEEQGREES
jgi:cell division protease FtsH